MAAPAKWQIRGVEAHEWRQVRGLRLAALADPDAALAFLESYDEAAAQPDSFWMERAEQNAAGEWVKSFIAEDGEGGWAGTVTVLTELPGAEAMFGAPASVPQGQVVAVFVRPEQRGTGVAEELFAAALAWAWGLDSPRLERVRLHVDERNTRAEALYRKLGFRRSGATQPVSSAPGIVEYELELRRPPDS